MLLRQAVTHLALALGLLQQAPQLMSLRLGETRLEEDLRHTAGQSASAPSCSHDRCGQMVLWLIAQSAYPLFTRISSAVN